MQEDGRWDGHFAKGKKNYILRRGRTSIAATRGRGVAFEGARGGEEENNRPKKNFSNWKIDFSAYEMSGWLGVAEAKRYPPPGVNTVERKAKR